MTLIDCALTNQALSHYDKGGEVGDLAKNVDIVSVGLHYEASPSNLI